jgi:site-specific recombinase XerD
MMLEELERRNYSQSTVSAYIRTIRDLERYFRRSPDQLVPEQLRQYQAYLFRERKLAPNTVNQRTAALRFFFVVTLKKPWTIPETPYQRKTFRLPKILSVAQVSKLIDAAPTLFYRVLLMALYATGLRRAELANLKVTDIDSERMVIHVKGGKGRKDRDVMLSPKLLEELRTYVRGLRRKPEVWLFPGNRPITTKVIWAACRLAATGAGLGDENRLHLKVLTAIGRCRTAALGGHLDECGRCGYRVVSFNSCRNRHCPQCQANARDRWLAARQRELLPAPYVHLVFTLPHELAPLALQDKRVMYDLLFRLSAETLLEIARDPKWLGAEIGFFSVLHNCRF